MHLMSGWTLAGAICCLFLTQPISAISGSPSGDACVLDESLKQQDSALLQVKSATKGSDSIVPDEQEQEALVSTVESTVVQEISCAGCAGSKGIGSSADLNSIGFGEVQAKCCSKEMAAFIERMILATKDGDGVCYKGDLMGMAIWYDCPADGEAGRDFTALQSSIGPDSKARIGDCAWIGQLSACPKKLPSANCPSFPGAENPTPCGEDAPPPPFCSGTTTPADWTKYEDEDDNLKGVKVDIDTSGCNFTSDMKPIYVSSLGGKHSHAYTTGGSAVYKSDSPFEKGFRVYIRKRKDDDPVTLEEARDGQWHINWIAHATGLTTYPSATSCAGATEKGTTAWNTFDNGQRKGFQVDIDTTSCGFTERPIYQIAIRGKTKIWRCRMGIDLLNANSFRTSMEWNRGEAVDPPPNDPTMLWHMTYVAHPDALRSYPGGSSCAGETDNNRWEIATKNDGTVKTHAIKMSIDTSKCMFSSVPVYVTTLIGDATADGQMFRTFGSNAIYKPAKDGFEIMVACHLPCSPGEAKLWGWRVSWMAVTKGLTR